MIPFFIITHGLNILKSSSSLTRHTDIEIISPESEVIGLNASNLTIGSVFMNGEPTDFEYFEPYPQIKDDERCHPVSSYTMAADDACTVYLSSLDKEIMPNLFISCCKSASTQSDHDSQANEGGKSQNTETQDTIPNGHLDHDVSQVVEEIEGHLFLLFNLLLFGFSCRLILGAECQISTHKLSS